MTHVQRYVTKTALAVAAFPLSLFTFSFLHLEVGALGLPLAMLPSMIIFWVLWPSVLHPSRLSSASIFWHRIFGLTFYAFILFAFLIFSIAASSEQHKSAEHRFETHPTAAM